MLERIRQISDGNRKDIMGNLLLFLLYLGEVVYLYSASSAALIVCGMLGMITFLYIRKYDGSLLPLLACIAAGVIGLISINRIFVLNCGWSGNLRIVFISLPIAYLLCTVHINKITALLFYYAVLLYTAIMISLADPAELYRIFRASSRNYISVLLIACLFPYYLACEREHVEVSIFPALLSLPVSIYVQSRGGVVASGILVGLSFARGIYLGTVKKHFRNRKKLISFLISAGLLICIVFFSFSGGSKNYLSRFTEAQTYPVSRKDMWIEYATVTGSSAKNILLGPPLTACPLIEIEAYNSHNSYFMTHSYMGAIGLLIVLAGGMGCLILCLKKKEYALLFLSGTFLIRAVTDYMFPMLFCDCIILFMILKAGVEIRSGLWTERMKNILQS